MRWNLSELTSYRVHARDGSLGTVRDVYFDAEYWIVRYLAVTGDAGQAGPHKFLLPMEAIGSTDREYGLLSVKLGSAAVQSSPAVAVDRPITSGAEVRLRDYYGLPNYWADLVFPEAGAPEQLSCSPRLYSLEEVLGYRIYAGAYDIGYLIDLATDESSWTIQSLEVDASGCLPAEHIWVHTEHIQQMRRMKKRIDLTLPREALAHNAKAGLQLLIKPEEELGLPTHAAYTAPTQERIPAS
ncbi:MAG: hypothetical protein NTY53_26450 [Kiritimatiellaeota bacterium]|nr:hypothetical protein [Kiritimatiellota bacterium]